eukprot:SAG31_NODE_7564_length_1653_cov_1.233591_1_plen_275_part_00
MDFSISFYATWVLLSCVKPKFTLLNLDLFYYSSPVAIRGTVRYMHVWPMRIGACIGWTSSRQLQGQPPRAWPRPRALRARRSNDARSERNQGRVPAAYCTVKIPPLAHSPICCGNVCCLQRPLRQLRRSFRIGGPIVSLIRMVDSISTSNVCMISSVPTCKLNDGKLQPLLGYGTYKVGFVPASASASAADAAAGVGQVNAVCEASGCSKWGKAHRVRTGLTTSSFAGRCGNDGIAAWLSIFGLRRILCVTYAWDRCWLSRIISVVDDRQFSRC